MSVITATFNRAPLLERLHDSLVGQVRHGEPFRDLEWVIVDDGSSDDTPVRIESWIAAAELPITYIRQENAGKHVAVNRAVEVATGGYASIIDDDDVFAPNAFERMLYHWETIPVAERHGFSGVVGLCADTNGIVIGDRFPSDPLDCSPAELTYEHGITGDKQSLLRTDVLKRYPWPFSDLPGEVVVAIVWNRMSLEYRERHVNEIFAVKQYLPGGISDRALELQIRASVATRQFYLEESRLPVRMPVTRRMRSYVNYARFSFHARARVAAQGREMRGNVRWLAMLPVGYGLYLRDRRRFGDLDG